MGSPSVVTATEAKEDPFSFQQFHDLYSIFFLVAEAWLFHVAIVAVGFHMITRFEIVFETLQVGESFCWCRSGSNALARFSFSQTYFIT